MITLKIPDNHLYDISTKYLARDKFNGEHSYFGHLENSSSGNFLEGWRFPVIEAHKLSSNTEIDLGFNEVTFVYRAENPITSPNNIRVVGDFVQDSEGIPLTRLANSSYWTVTLKLTTGCVFNYGFIVDGEFILDPINSRRRNDRSLNPWSYFWTDYCREIVTFENWEIDILQRLTRHILPFQSQASKNFLSKLDPKKAGKSLGMEFRFDLEVGVVNFIDKLVAGPELHQRNAYKNCLASINNVMRNRNPYKEPKSMQHTEYESLYNDMANNSNLGGWDYSTYQNPSYFLKLLRRHTILGAFSHPKYGGNAGAYAWDYLAEQYGPFDWRQGLEKPWGTSQDYLG